MHNVNAPHLRELQSGNALGSCSAIDGFPLTLKHLELHGDRDSLDLHLPSSIETLKLSKITIQSLPLRTLTHLASVNIYDCMWGDQSKHDFLDELSRANSVHTLQLQANFFEDFDNNTWPKQPYIHALEFSFDYKKKIKNIEDVLKKFSALKKLNISRLDVLEGIKHDALTQLEELHIGSDEIAYMNRNEQVTYVQKLIDIVQQLCKITSLKTIHVENHFATSTTSGSPQKILQQLRQKLSDIKAENLLPDHIEQQPQACDTKVNEPKKTFDTKKNFLYETDGTPIFINKYRFTVMTFDETQLNKRVQPSDAAAPILLKAVPVKTMEWRNPEKLSHDLLYPKQDDGSTIGVIQLSNKWQQLPSRDGNDVLSKYYCSEDVEFKYSPDNNMYYAHLKTGQQTQTLQYLIAPPASRAEQQLPPEVKKIITDIQAYQKQDLKQPVTDKTTVREFLNNLQESKTGACRHRALLFAYLINELKIKDLEVRIVENDVHDFVELRMHGGAWFSYNLGGYSAHLTLSNPEKLLSSTQPQQVAAAAAEPQPKKVTEAAAKPQPVAAHWAQQFLQPSIKNAPTLTDQTEKLRFYQQVVAAAADVSKKHLIELSGSDEVHAMHLALEGYCGSTQRPVFFINSPDELNRLTPFIYHEAEDAVGKVKSDGGGPLDSFLIKNNNQHPVLIINYDNFAADDIVRLNSVLDKNPAVDGKELPKDTVVIGLTNKNKLNYYTGRDFFSRFDAVTTFDEPVMNPKKLENPPVVDDDAIVINLFKENNWKERLLGFSTLNEHGQFVWVAGELSAAFKEGKQIKQIKLLNGPDTRDFAEWVEAQQYIHKLNIVTQDSSSLSELIQKHTYSAGLQSGGLVLNPETYAAFFEQYNIENGACKKTPGLLLSAQNPEKEAVSINLTHALTDSAWEKLLDYCQKHSIKLNVHCAPGIALPAGVQQLPQTESVDNSNILNSAVTMQYSADPDAIISQDQTYAGYAVFDISECSSNELLHEISMKITDQGMEFEQKDGLLLDSLKNGKSIILKGHFSEELINVLAPYLLDQQQQWSGKVLILPQPGSATFAFGPAVDQKAIISTVEPVAQQAARERYKAVHGVDSNTDVAWSGINTAPQIMLDSIDSQEFQKKRETQVMQILKTPGSQHAVLTGLSGVGKSTFIEQTFAHKADIALYSGENKLAEWAKDPQDKLKILFIDEANLSARQWSEFEGLYNTPPSIRIGAQNIQLTDQHKVIFAANPNSFGGERQSIPFFQRHGNAVVFDPLPASMIKESVLMPVLQVLPDNYNKDALCDPLIAIYNALCEYSAKSEQLLISPREIKMMALLTVAYQKNHPDASSAELVQIAKRYAIDLVQHLVPAEHMPDFQKYLKDLQPPQPREKTADSKEFLVTESRQPISDRIDDWLALRTLKQNNSHDVNLTSGGLGGLIIEGEPGIGKSELVINKLIAQGFTEYHWPHTDQDKDTDKVFYRMPQTLTGADKEKFLLHAFEQGAIVIIDEINAFGSSERLLNDLLMGKHPDPNKSCKPGFMIIGTQNPSTLAGRHEESAALARRTMKVSLPHYSQAETIAILQSKGLNLIESEHLAAEYFKQRTHTNPPAFRDLMQSVDYFIRAKNDAWTKFRAQVENNLGDDQIAKDWFNGHKDDNHEKFIYELLKFHAVPEQESKESTANYMAKEFQPNIENTFLQLKDMYRYLLEHSIAQLTRLSKYADSSLSRYIAVQAQIMTSMAEMILSNHPKMHNADIKIRAEDISMQSFKAQLQSYKKHADILEEEFTKDQPAAVVDPQVALQAMKNAAEQNKPHSPVK